MQPSHPRNLVLAGCPALLRVPPAEFCIYGRGVISWNRFPIDPRRLLYFNWLSPPTMPGRLECFCLAVLLQAPSAVQMTPCLHSDLMDKRLDRSPARLMPDPRHPFSTKSSNVFFFLTPDPEADVWDSSWLSLPSFLATPAGCSDLRLLPQTLRFCFCFFKMDPMGGGGLETEQNPH